ncbi:MAG: hypothetical protein WDM76_06990 [Limisphaerales bacterium]
MREVSLSAVMQALSDPCRIAIVHELIRAKGRALAVQRSPAGCFQGNAVASF